MDENKRLERIEDKIDKVSDHLSSIDSTLAKQEVNLAIHMKRSDALEAQIEPIKEHVAMVAGAIKLAKWLGAILGTGGVGHMIMKLLKVY